ncbi:hypothetical protein F4808DRAFT_191802 [Astrocystis sublimbata]|nr:hypothetical protein F4808DRAFT_191802 [Astrocystis sublimbata]
MRRRKTSIHCCLLLTLGFQNIEWDAVWICNCKTFMRDHVVGPEIDEAQEILAKKCGPNKGGWAWSNKWQKSYNFGKVDMFLEPMSVIHPSQKCPQHCIIYNDPEGPSGNLPGPYPDDPDDDEPPDNHDPTKPDPDDGDDGETSHYGDAQPTARPDLQENNQTDTAGDHQDGILLDN